MKLKESINELVQSGIQPLQLSYDAIRFFDGEEKILRSYLSVESLDIGHLTYKEYRFVARRTKLGNAMVQRHIEKLFREYPKLIKKRGVKCITLPVYARLLMGGALSGLLFDALTYFEKVEAEKICIELSADILYEDMKEARLRIDELRTMGFRVAICEVGDEFCPVFRLAELRFDYAFVDEYVTASLTGEDAERVAGSIVKFLRYMGVRSVAPHLKKRKEIAIAQSLGFDGYGMAAPSSNIEEVKA